MAGSRIVVIGTSAGGVSALERLISRFEAHWPVSVFVTIHTGKNRNMLPEILRMNSRLPVQFAEHEKAFGKGVYVAPPDRHLLIGETSTILSAGPTENHARPAIDPMFRSAATHHGPRVVGVLLTGYLYDGMNGLYEIHRHGGSTIVQDPTDAKVSDMPLNALRRLRPDHVLPLVEIPNALADLLEERDETTLRRRRT